MIRFSDITNQILKYHPKANLDLVEKAYVYSAKVHQGQIRLSGEPYLSHPLEVAYILATMKMDTICIVAGLLHDTLEDTQASYEEIKRLFGEETAVIVDGVTKISRMRFSSAQERQAENIRKMILAMSADIRVILVKLADRLHNMRTLGYQPPDKQKRIARETLDIYAPLAGRMGIYWIKSDLEDLSLYYLEPEIYNKIKSEIARKKGEREKFIQEVCNLLSTRLFELGIKATVKGRHKHFYSIYKKMVDQDLSVDQVYDILAFRVIVQSVKECYEALGHIHSMWKPVPGRFKDYISVPKMNMYQSLHTTVIGPLGEIMEIQIRTWEMDTIAEQGIAAHWKYKEGGAASKTDEKQFAWLRQLLEWQQNLRDPTEFLESVRMDLFPNEVYVFTPRGEVKEFPKGATPVDFAYSIHSEVGQHCMGAKVNGKMVPLRYQLKNGDVVEIITSPKAHPSKDWLEFVKTPKARNKIRQWINNQEREESIAIGKNILERALEQIPNLELANLQKNGDLASVAKDLSFHSVEDLFAQIGFGKISSKQVLGRLRQKLGLEEEKPPGIVSKMVRRLKRRKPAKGIKVRGISDVLVRFAHCCNPLPGEEVIGYITRGRGITIHHKDCAHIKDADPDRLVDVTWESTEDDVYLARLKVTSIDKKGILADISAAIAQKDANIIQAEIKTTTDKKGIALFTIEVEDYLHLKQILDAIKKVKNVLAVERI
ncbi:MAG: bifunctional (p)ppGpp synthetase/guanosine-3',5'-bis(diphosphate) 3'-pyrophosphohydrolase [Deltaproteobacteria bacterium]|nr:bifunctional (p)ppGpp synthetase/guanosine-3',5'-bis(diphosphate) 3'-pyrophosphohydrolase [Deltaproteobacteria bacterium]MBW1928740.1 bifunctional (p)ppGpp synthetase/guanosine-3',5'-bis(diphosphate) 3'-pyrophosphohydrolase [Deltaproteobacteria bacterium]MBW2024485.1 bifunctional (p)ppGpp synthetase/guanosine-3',5'-bis(diphosphate) 3'-pyrophosphohydrolase [Deltaproteobacteria bacterium]MBW2124112.1 bifunctional (p)ppGpp synthetase/guanosine-3',5'-bis(diphosphate) 3'-pyrophosphohydrolase [Delt